MKAATETYTISNSLTQHHAPQIEDSARAEKARNVWVAASDFNAGAIRLYERHGFARVAVIDSLVSDGRDEVLLRKKL